MHKCKIAAERFEGRTPPSTCPFSPPPLPLTRRVVRVGLCHTLEQQAGLLDIGNVGIRAQRHGLEVSQVALREGERGKGERSAIDLRASR